MTWWLLTVAVITAVVILILSAVFVTKLIASEERGSAWIPRVAAVVSICVAFYTVLLLPFDVASSSEHHMVHNISVRLLWQIALLTYYVLLVATIPFSMAHYDAWEPDQSNSCSQVQAALMTSTLSTVLSSSIIVGAWLALGYVDTTVQDMHMSAPLWQEAHSKTLISVDTFVLAVAAVLGWGALIVFGGVGLVAVPLQGVIAFVRRPQPISAAQFETERLRIHTATEHLLEKGRRLEQEAGPNPSFKSRRKMLAFRRDARLLQDEYEKLETCFHLSGGSVLWHYMRLAASLTFVATSLVWTLHVILHTLTHVHPCLNNILLSLQVFFPMAATLVYAWLAFYLMACTIVGCWAIGEHLALFPVFALQINKTMLNALLFNCILLLLSSVAVLQLCVAAFDEYDKDTVVYSLFKSTEQIFGVRIAFAHAPVPLLVVELASAVWLLICPRVCAHHEDDEDDYYLI